MDRVHEHRGEIVADVGRDRPIAEQRAGALHRVVHEVREHERRSDGVERPALDPADIEEVADELCEALGLAVDARRRRADLGGRPLDLGVGQRAGRGADGGERGAQLVGHGIEQRRLQLVASAGDLRGRGLLGEAVAFQAAADLVGGSGEEPRLLDRRGSRSRPPQRADQPRRPAGTAIATTYGISARGARRPGAATVPAWTSDHSAGSSPERRWSTAETAVPGNGLAGSVSATTRSRSPRRRSSCGARAMTTRSKRVSVASVRATSPSASAVVDASASVRLIDDRARASRSRRSEAAVRSRCVPASRPTTTPTNSRSSRSRQLRWIRDEQRVPGLDEQDVVEDERADGACDGRPRAVQDAREDDRHEIRRRGVRHVGDALEDGDRDRRDGERKQDGHGRPGGTDETGHEAHAPLGRCRIRCRRGSGHAFLSHP